MCERRTFTLENRNAKDSLAVLRCNGSVDRPHAAPQPVPLDVQKKIVVVLRLWLERDNARPRSAERHPDGERAHMPSDIGHLPD